MKNCLTSACLFFCQTFNDELTSDQLLSMILIIIFSLYKNKPKEEDENEECIAEDEIKVWNLATKFAASIYYLIISFAQSYQNKDENEENKFLPSIKIFSDWILCSGSSILLEDSFIRNQEYVSFKFAIIILFISSFPFLVFIVSF